MRYLASACAALITVALSGCIATAAGIVGSRIPGPDRFRALDPDSLHALPANTPLSVRDTAGAILTGGFGGASASRLLLRQAGSGQEVEVPIGSVATVQHVERTSRAGRGFLLGLAADVALFYFAVSNLPPW